MSNSAVFLFGGSLGTLPRDFPPVRRVLCPQLPRKEPPFCPQRLRTQNKVPREWRSLEGCMGQALCTPSWAEGRGLGRSCPSGQPGWCHTAWAGLSTGLPGLVIAPRRPGPPQRVPHVPVHAGFVPPGLTAQGGGSTGREAQRP